MKKFVIVLLSVIVLAIISGLACYAEDPILVGVPTALTALEGRESLNAVQMAVDEINATGGVKVGSAKRLLKIETIDLRRRFGRSSCI